MLAGDGLRQDDYGAMIADKPRYLPAMTRYAAAPSASRRASMGVSTTFSYTRFAAEVICYQPMLAAAPTRLCRCTIFDGDRRFFSPHIASG